MATFIRSVDGRVQVEIEPETPATMLPNISDQGLQAQIDALRAEIRTYRGQPVVVTDSADMEDELTIYLYMGSEEGYNANHWYYYDGTEWVDGGEYVANPVLIDDTLTQSGEAADAKVTGDEISAIKADLTELETKVDEVVVYPNLANPNAFIEGKYVAPNGAISTSSNYSYSEKITVTTGQIIKANHRARFITAYNGDTANAEAGVNDQTGADAPTTYTVPEDITDLIFTFKTEYLTDLIIYIYDGVDYEYIPYGEPVKINTDLLPTALGVYAERKGRRSYVATKGNAIAANEYISLPVFCSTRKNTRLVFRAVISTLGNFEIGFTTAASATGIKYNRFLIGTNTVRCYYAYNYSTSSMDSEVTTHDLNISSGLLEIIIEELPDAKVSITIGNNGNSFTHTFDGYVKNNLLQPYCLAAFGVFGEYSFTWSCTDLYKDIWLFGDSYMSYSDARWAYYLEEYGYAKNVLINSFPGCWSSAAITAFNNLIKHGNPDFAVWGLGMNDGADSENAPSTAWTNGKNSFLEICEANNITPIFCTIPTVPTINHEQKNAWIRSSGYRYIDFAKAVNAQSNGTWNSGMLSSDGVHPTINGAKALFSEVLLDFPEIMLN